jgi:hypothetical protein
MSDHRQRQRHGVHKNLVEGIGGLLVGVALVVVARGIARRRSARVARTTPETEAQTAVEPKVSAEASPVR